MMGLLQNSEAVGMKKLFLMRKEENFLVPPLLYPTQKNTFRLTLPSQSYYILVCFVFSLYKTKRSVFTLLYLRMCLLPPAQLSWLSFAP